MRRIAVAGAGAWGRALALQARRAGLEVELRGRGPARRIDAFDVTPLDAPNLRADALFVAVKAAAAVAVAEPLIARLDHDVPLVLCAKGLDEDGPRLIVDALETRWPGRIVMVLSGPSFADEVAEDRPTALTLAAPAAALESAERLARALHTRHFRPYLSDDPVGVQIGGVAKNVAAIACGMARGLNLGSNAEAALITRALAEMARLGVACGGRPETFMGLSGLGDLVLTCAGPHSRNFRFGQAIANGADADVAERQVGLAEGRRSAHLLPRLARAHGVELPIAAGIDTVLHHRLPLAEALDRLLERPLGREI